MGYTASLSAGRHGEPASRTPLRGWLPVAVDSWIAAVDERPDLVIHQLTGARDPAASSPPRIEGTGTLVGAAPTTGVRRVLAHRSVARRARPHAHLNG